jgi:hypothetical protein
VDITRGFVEAFVEESHRLHEQPRGNVSGLDADVLNWTPDDTNSIASLVIHTRVRGGGASARSRRSSHSDSAVPYAVRASGPARGAREGECRVC